MPLGGNIGGIRNPIIDSLIQHAEAAPSIESSMIASRALDRVLLWGFYHVPLGQIDQERFIFWDKFSRPEKEAIAEYEYLVGSTIRILDSWWAKPPQESD